jgi:hypothetical protein
MINTIIDPTGSADELRSMQEALSSLVRAGLVRMALSTDPTKKLGRYLVMSLLQCRQRSARSFAFGQAIGTGRGVGT